MKTQTVNTNKKGLKNIFLLFLIVVITFIAYSNSFDCSFHFDDYDNIVNNKSIQDLNDFDSWWNFSPNRRVSMFTFVVNYHFSQEDVFTYHLVNFIIHLLTSALIFFFVLKLFETPVLKDYKTLKEIKLLAFFTAVIFAVHPLGTQSVTYIIQRQNALATMFYIAAILVYLKLRINSFNSIRKGFLAFVLIVFSFLAFFSKENAYTLPIMLLSVEFFLFRSGKIFSNLKKRNVLFLGAGLILIAGFVIYWFSFSVFKPLPPNQAMGNAEVITSYNYFLTQLSVIPKYLQMIVVPVNQNIDHDIALKTSFADIGVLAGLSMVLALLFLVYYFYKRNRLLSFGIIWFFIAISIEASIIPIQDVFFEHRTYLPSIGIILAVLLILSNYLFDKHQKLLIGVLLSIVLLSSYMTFNRNKVWQDEISLWTDAVAKSPNKPRPYVNLGNAYELKENWQKAIEFYSKSIELSDKYAIVYYNRANVYSKLGDFDNAIADYSKAVSISPGYGTAYYNRGLAYSRTYQHDLAVADYSKSIELNPEFYNAYYNRGLDYLALGNYHEAINDFDKSINNNPEFVIAYVNRGVAYLNLQQYDEAIADFDKAETIEPQAEMIYFNRGLAYQALENYRKAIEDFGKIISLNPNYTMAYFNRGNNYFVLGEYPNAIADYQTVIRLDPSITKAQENLNKALKLTTQ